MSEHTPQKGGVVIADQIRGEGDRVVEVVELDQGRAAFDVDAAVGRLGDVDQTLAEDGVGLVEEE
jgi:hypothetical protein